MGFRIEDGKGLGRFASVDSNLRLEVSSVTTPIISSRSQTGDSFSILGHHTIQASATTENLAFIQNGNADKNIYIQTVTYAVQITGVIELILAFGATRTSGGTVKTPVQLNRGSAKASGLLAWDNSSNNLVLGTTLAEDFSYIRLGLSSSAYFTSEGSVVLGPGDALYARVIGTAGDKVTAGSFFYEVREE